MNRRRPRLPRIPARLESIRSRPAGVRRTGAIVIGAMAALLGIFDAGARAGTYDVVACGGAAGGAHTAFAAAADSGMAAYTICPNTPSNASSGLVTRASAAAGHASVPYFAGAYQIFEAPPGASLASVAFDVAVIRLSMDWTTGIVAYDGDFNRGDLPYGCYRASPGCTIGAAAFFGPVSAGLGGHSRFRFETRCGSLSGCDISASGFQPGMRALFSAANVTVRVQDSTTPSVVPLGGSLFSNQWLRGLHFGTSSELDNVGIMLNRTWVDGRQVYSEDFRDDNWPAGVHCDYRQRAPCNNINGAGSYVDTRALADGAHELRVEATDTAGNAGSAVRTIKVDNSAPVRVNASVEAGEGWRQTNGFAIRWRSPPDQVAPIAKAHYTLCQTTTTRTCWSASQAGERIERLTDVRVPEPGDYTLQVWLEDQAGNAAAGNASDPVHLRFDDVPPELADFELLDENDPRRVEARVSDATSGLSAGTVEIRRAGYRQWHILPTTVAAGVLSTYIDDLSLADGTYALRARVYDRAGNERIGDRRRDGTTMELALPLRLASRLTLAAVQHCPRSERRRRARCRPTPDNSAGRTLAATHGPVSGVLRTTRGEPIPNAGVELLEEPRTGGGFRQVGTVQTGPRGEFSHRVPPGPSRTLRFRYGGTLLIKSAAADVELLVPAKTSVRAGRSFLRNGDSVRFSGRLAGRPVPDGGKLIDLQAFVRGRWRTFATPRSDSHGRWAFRYRFEATRGLVTYRFRALVRREAAYPYELGRSRVVRVRVRGP